MRKLGLCDGFWLLLLLPAPILVGAKFHQVDLTNLEQKTDPASHNLDPKDPILSWVTQVYDPLAITVYEADAATQWDSYNNVTAENDAAVVLSTAQTAVFTKVMSKQIEKLNGSLAGADSRTQRLYREIHELGDAALPDADLNELTQIIADMTNVWSTATVCADPNAPKDNCPVSQQLPRSPDIVNFMAESRDAAKLKYFWQGWRDATGPKVRKLYIRYVQLKNKAAVLNGYEDYGQYWRSNYAVPSIGYSDADVLKDLDSLFEQLTPLYAELHAYIRRKLIQKYPQENIDPKGPIPGHLIGNLWGISWLGLLDFTQLFPNKPNTDVTDEMKRQNYTVDKMVELSQQFQLDLGLIPMPEQFFKNSRFVKPTDRIVNCQASAWDFSVKNDVRINACLEVNADDFYTLHHEMGHIQYYLQYGNQSTAFRTGANPAFHEAVGDTLSLSVSTSKHLAGLGLLSNFTEDVENDLNYQFTKSLDQIAFLAFGFMQDRYRYDVFSGKIPTDKLEQTWLDYVLKYQGLFSPVSRTENDFDVGSRYHVVADVEYMRYFLSNVLEFQFHKALCDASGHVGPLYRCDINGSKAAGKRMSDMLKLGSSVPWPDALEKITGVRKVSAAPLVEFFDPLIQRLKEINAANGDTPGWIPKPPSYSGYG